MKHYKLGSFLTKYFPYAKLTRLYRYLSEHRWVANKEVVETFLGHGLSAREVSRHLRGVRQAYVRYAWLPEEYFLYRYDLLSTSGRRAFVPDIEKDRFCDKVNSPQVFDIFYNKGNIYSHFSQFYRREVCVLHSADDDLTALEDFLSRHDVAVVKPLRSSLGQGVKILHDASIQEVLSLMEEYPLGIIVEEMIRQCREMALPHPQSVNTVRLTTYIVDGKVNVLRRPFVRFGTSGNVVDNGAQGGLFSAIDYDTGIVIGVCDEHGRRHVVHPDSGVPLVGFQVPRWGEAIDFVKELAGVLPFCRYIGWDIALTEKGWVMVEGNSHGQFIGFQLPRNKGFRDELLSVDPEALTFKRR